MKAFHHVWLSTQFLWLAHLAVLKGLVSLLYFILPARSTAAEEAFITKAYSKYKEPSEAVMRQQAKTGGIGVYMGILLTFFLLEREKCCPISTKVIHHV